MGLIASKKPAPQPVKLKEQEYSWSSRVLGRGELSTVYFATALASGKQVAIKRIAPKQLNSKTHGRLVKEAALLHDISESPEVTQKFAKLVEGFIDHEGGLNIVMDHVNGGDLFDLMRKRPKGFSEQRAKNYIKQLLKSLHFLHHHDIAHLDLKLENIMYDKDNKRLKIIDFGFATKTSKINPDTGIKEKILLNTFCGSLNYTPPEIIKKVKFDGKQADIWSLGVVCFILLTGKFPFDAYHPNEVYKSIVQGSFVFPEHLSPGAKSFLNCMLDIYPDNRSNVTSLLKHSWLNDC